MITEIPLAEYKKAEEELHTKEARIRFIIHAITYLIFNLSFLVVNLIFQRESLWFFYPLISWGIGLCFHYLYGIRWLQKVIERQQAKVESRARQNLLQRGDTYETQV
jgi:hypothetical protein